MKKIKINGVMWNCRKLDVGNVRKIGDVYRDGAPIRLFIGTAQRMYDIDVYRKVRKCPLPTRVKRGGKVKPWGSFTLGPKPVKAWGGEREDGSLMGYAWQFLDIAKKELEGSRVKPVRVLITLAPSGKKKEGGK